jgi:hypothetical protein
MPTIIEQKPGASYTPVGQDLIYVVSNDTIVAQQTKVKFIAEVHVSTSIPNTSTATDVIGTFKVTPNNKGRGVFNMSNILENYVKADNLGGKEGSVNSSYKGTSGSGKPHPIHLIDKFSFNNNTVRWFAIQFKIEYLGATPCSGTQDDNVVALACGQAVNSDAMIIWNGYVKATDEIYAVGTYNQNFAWSFVLNEDLIPHDSDALFLTNAPSTQYANPEDYGVLSFINPVPFHSVTDDILGVKFDFFDSSGNPQGSESVNMSIANGGFSFGSQNVFTSKRFLMFVGAYPGNLQNFSTTFRNLVTADTIQGGYYDVYLVKTGSVQLTKKYRINVNCPDLKGYESIRLAWMNQWGVWDYYTFTKKSTRNTSTEGTTYQQLGGTWNSEYYRPYGYKGGKKVFRTQATERITMNTDFVTEDFNTTFEELINSPEVYMLKGYSNNGDNTWSTLHTYVTPVRLTTSSFTRKTVANDKLIQYTFDIELSRMLNTQSI